MPQVATQGDVTCLQGVKSLLADPQGRLNSWVFPNDTSLASGAFLCKFVGVSCWNEKENRVLKLELKGMNLSGTVPSSLSSCSSLQTLDLSNNGITGEIPRQICAWVPYLVVLDLSSNDLSGPIPSELVNCSFLNSLVLSNNQLTGTIPYELSGLARLKRFSVVNNKLVGRIPGFFSVIEEADFKGNWDLCGKPWRGCGGLSRRNLKIVIFAGVFGASCSLVFGLGIWWWYYSKYSKRSKRGSRFGVIRDDDDNAWVEKIRTHKHVQVSLFQKPIVKLKLADLIAATNGFCSENIVFATRTGPTYKAILSDGSALAIKRLSTCKLSEREFRAEMIQLGQLRHPNLVPLLGFCTVEDEKLLVYKHTSNGTLHSLLHGGDGDGESKLDWPTRFRIGLGIAHGLAWLHHGCSPPILHRNFCSSAVLVDEDFDARIIDFGLGKLTGSSTPSDCTNDNIFVTNNLGEFGYVAPEYLSTMAASPKGDVYAFGVVLLELATGQKSLEVSTDEPKFKGNLVEWVNALLSGTGGVKDGIDKSLLGRGHVGEILKFVEIAVKCTVTRPRERWSMYRAYRSLKGIAQQQGMAEQYEEFPLNFIELEN
ncbi:hypothetical protein MLD38_000172 [Melastoma candidum]|nr:hypothetical protein MLD38_000172 [Melastoma candidum]